MYIVFLIISVIVFSCEKNNTQSNNNQNNNNKKQKVINIKKIEISENDENVLHNNDTIYINGRSIIFFTKNKKEFQKMLNTGGEESKWEFDMIYSNFKKIAENSNIPLKELNIYSVYTDKPVIQFLSEKKDTFIFNRTTNDYFIGQLFFNGIDSFRLEEGLINTDELELLITDFFKLKSDINIKQVQEISDSFRYYHIDTSIVTISDTIGN
jgi:hypothetical protein